MSDVDVGQMNQQARKMAGIDKPTPAQTIANAISAYSAVRASAADFRTLVAAHTRLGVLLDILQSGLIDASTPVR